MKGLAHALALVALLAPSKAALRFGCSTVTIQRLDPVVEPGNTPSAHLHQVVGGNAFGPVMNGDIGEQGSCTTCTFSEDFSNYWTAVLFFKHQNGSYKRVPIMENAALPAGINGGMTIYYTQQDFNTNGKQHITAFKPGFRMTVGSPMQGADGLTKHKGLRFTCLENKNTRFPEISDFPKQACKGGLMTEHHFPACWDGKNLDSPDHQSHMYDTQPTGFAAGAACPSTHPVRMPQLAYETLWDTTQFTSMWPKDGSNPLVFSFGDTEGHAYGTHADYMFGWKGDSLQRAMNSSCMFTACENGKPLKSQSVAEMNKCSAKNVVNENIDGWLDALPGRPKGT
ncbi:uncharacterized protein BDR25DRAFT_319431 [Lindgomyces ingoldianus]|uniref:Uncharacterized protein n=1 Tax=Lindgomyces ingoldianus TaxID=673940 RepID=A0ACB6QDF1_9PLEO|nr:uncharacterized protein BDR25DRAFT_319431 [Lindgomyces ingoldianus]KAF2464165.1 hypothetical protein BDR25DRAFT_319431 [Lindgomyces ingoldianus]